jgi:hypothetical protein
MANALTDKNWRAELIYQGVSYGFWNRDETSFGSETSTVYDPEYGPEVIGGSQTAENVDLNRPWRKGRERPTYNALKPLRGRGSGTLIIHELDELTGQPLTSQPLDTLKVIITDVKIPKGDAGGSDNSVITVTVQVQP